MRNVASLAVVGLVAHVFFTVVYNFPNDDIKYNLLPGELADQYIDPYLLQDYQLFAPTPPQADRNLWIRAKVETPTGERLETDWVDATSIELAEPYRRVMRKQLSIIAGERVASSFQGLSEEQREIAAEDFSDDGDLIALREDLVAADEEREPQVGGFIRATNFATSFATQAAKALWGEQGEIVAVQVRSVSTPVARWDGEETPGASAVQPGWMSPLEWQEQSPEGFAGSFRRWAEAAGVSTDIAGGGQGSASDDPDTDGGGER